MIIRTVKQLWKERGDNVWLFAELVIIAIFLWQAIDPLYTLNRVKNIPKGFNPENICRVYIHEYYKSDKEYDASVDDSRKTQYASITSIFNNIVSLPEIESYYGGFGIPYGGFLTTIHIYYNENGEEDNGEGRKEIEPYYYSVGRGEFFKVLQIKDIKTGQYPTQLQKGEIQLSRSAAMELFGTTDCIGREVENEYGIRKLKITGVYEDFQSNPYMIPEPTVVANYADNPPEFIYLRLKEGVDRDSFIKRFNEELQPTLRVGNRYAGTMVDFEYVIEENMYNVTHESKNRFQLFISFFALFCAFLGIVSTFWIRTNDRRGEIGIMRSVGASRHRIIGQLVTEALLLVTMSFAVALPLIAHLVIANDFAQPTNSITNEQLARYSEAFATAPRFAVITVITYLIIAVTAAVAAIIPAARACKTGIADALHEE